MARLGSLNNKVFHEDSHSTRTQNGTSTDSRIYQYRRQRSQRSELSRKETYFVSQGSRAVRKVNISSSCFNIFPKCVNFASIFSEYVNFDAVLMIFSIALSYFLFDFDVPSDILEKS
uniref:Uncharacterized protein n=1 Tax=Wuchereria bancrofti TaxID=6293 RepID=A0AAF5RVP1_WUCBA